jgi:hypothetical protein
MQIIKVNKLAWFVCVQTVQLKKEMISHIHFFFQNIFVLNLRFIFKFYSLRNT